MAVNKKRERIYKEFKLGLLEGAAGAGLTWSAGWSLFPWNLLLFPILALLRAIQKAKKQYDLEYCLEIEKAKLKNDPEKPTYLSLFCQVILAGIISGAGAGLSYGFFFAPFTFGFSLIACAGIGAAIGAVSAALSHAGTRFVMSNEKSVLMKQEAHDSGKLGMMVGAAIGFILTPFVPGLSILIGALVGAAVGYAVGAVSSLILDRYKCCRGKPDSKKVGTSLGTSIGIIIGIICAPFTMGGSLVCALLGGAICGFIGRQIGQRYDLEKSPCCSPESTPATSVTDTTFTDEGSLSIPGNFVPKPKAVLPKKSESKSSASDLSSIPSSESKSPASYLPSISSWVEKEEVVVEAPTKRTPHRKTFYRVG